MCVRVRVDGAKRFHRLITMNSIPHFPISPPAQINITQIFIKKTYRIGVWTPIFRNADGKVAVPYTFNANFAPLYKTQRPFSVGQVRTWRAGVAGTNLGSRGRGVQGTWTHH